MVDFNDVSEDSLNNKLWLQLGFFFILLIIFFKIFHVKTKKNKEIQLAQSFKHCIFPTICTIKKIFTMLQ